MTPPHLHVIGVDPGKTTGWCRLTVPRASIFGDEAGAITEWDYGELTGPEPDQVMQIARLARETQGLDYLIGPAFVVEDFDIEPHNVTTDPELLSPVRIAAMLSFVFHLGSHSSVSLTGDARMILQSRGQAKSTATDDRLKKWGLYAPGSDHVRDATRHAITAIRRAKTSPELRAQLWNDPSRMVLRSLAEVL